jgi:hypothetical protein
MAQGDMNIANQGFPAFRADLNDQLEALVTNSSGATAPSTTFPHQWWLDTSTTPSTLRQRNAANDAWIVVGLLNQSTNTFNLPVAQGGTGAADAGGARTNLGALASTDPSYTGTLTGGTGVINIGSGQLFKDASGNVGIGTSSVTNPYSSANYRDLNFDGVWGGVISFKLGGTLTGWVGNSSSGNQWIGMWGASGQPIVFGTNGNNERMRIDSSGNLLVGATTQPSTPGRIYTITQTGVRYGLKCAVPGTTANTAVAFENANGVVGTIGVSGSSTSYNTSSDYRLKHDIQPMTGALAKVQQLKPVTYKWNADDSQSQGFIAHELQEVVPECVSGEKDAVDADGKPEYQGIDTSFLVATLTAALQEAVAKIAALEARLDAANL